MRRGSISTTVSAILSLVALLMVLTSIIATYRSELAGYTALVSRGREVLEKAGAQVRAVVDSNGLIIVTDKPPLMIVGVLALYPDGRVQKLINAPLVVRNDSLKLLDMDVVERLANQNCRVMILLGNGDYIVKNLNLSLRLLRESSPSLGLRYKGSVNSGLSSIENLIKLDPYLVGGEAVNPSNFLQDPVPGGPEDVGANYVPEVTVMLRGESLSNIANFLSIAYDEGNHSYTLYLSNPKLNFRKYYAFLLLVPILINKLSKPQSLGIHIYVKPINNFPLSGLDIFHLNVAFRPAWFAVLPIDYWRTPLVTIPGSVMFIGQSGYSVAKALKYWMGREVNVTLKAYQLGPNGRVVCGSMDKHIVININPSEIWRSLPSNLSSVIVLAGIQLVVGYYWSYNQWMLTNPFAEIRLNIYNLTPQSIIIGNDLVGKPVLLPLPPQGLSIRIIDPEGNQVKLFRKPSNVVVNVDGIRYGVAYFIPKEAGTYKVTFSLGGSTPLANSLNITLLSNPEPKVASASGPISNARVQSYSSGEDISLMNNRGLISFNYTLTYSFSESFNTLASWLTPVKITFTGVSNVSGYYFIKAYDESRECPSAGTNGWRSVSNEAVIKALMFDHSIYACKYAITIKAEFREPDNIVFTSSLTASTGSFGTERFLVAVSNHGPLKLSTKVNGLLITYYVNNESLIALISPEILNNLVTVK